MEFFVPDLSMCWNGHGVQGYKFTQTMWIKKGESIRHAMEWTRHVADTADPPGLSHLVIKCHGRTVGLMYQSDSVCRRDDHDEEGGSFGLLIGDEIYFKEAQLFSVLKGAVKCIYIYACCAAADAPTAARLPNRRNSHGNGGRFCQLIANHSGAKVIAPTSEEDDLPSPGRNGVHVFRYGGRVFHPGRTTTSLHLNRNEIAAALR
jgi:hypothetical protein